MMRLSPSFPEHPSPLAACKLLDGLPPAFAGPGGLIAWAPRWRPSTIASCPAISPLTAGRRIGKL